MNKATESKLLKIFGQKVPANAVHYCFNLWKEAPFHFTISKSRKTKLGDYKYRSDQTIQKITINHELNPYQFLITYIHEVAHHHTFLKYGGKVKPHGPEWKRNFQNLLFPILHESVFPRDILLPLKRHMKNPKASSGADFWLNKELRKHDKSEEEGNAIYLHEIKIGSVFELQGRKFRKILPKRTRILCEEISSGKRYLISGNAEIIVT